MLWRAIILFLIFSLALFAVTELVLPRVLSGVLKDALATYTGSEDITGVKLSAWPAAKMLTGQFDAVTVEAQNVPYGNLVIDSVVTTLDHLSVNMKDLLLKREFKPTYKGVRASVRIGEANLNRYVWAGVTGAKNGLIKLGPNGATITADLTLLNQTVPLLVDGKFVVVDPKTVAFDPTGFSFGGVPLDERMVTLVKNYGWLRASFDLSKLPVDVTGITTGDGYLTITGTK